MSLILDAINKATREREYSEKVPDLQTVHHSRGYGGGSWRWLLLLSTIVAILFVVAVALVFFYLREARLASEPSVVENVPHREQIEAVNLAESSGVASARGKQRIAANARSQSTAGAQNENAQVQALYDVQRGSVEVVEPVVRPAETEMEPKQTTVDEGLARSLWEEIQTKPLPQVRPREQVIEPEPVAAVPLPESAVEADFASTMAAFDAVPFLHELPTSKQDGIPTLMYSQHQFDEQRVTINKKSFSVGQSVARGIILERILADGVLLNYNGQQFKLAALSSWVNS